MTKSEFDQTILQKAAKLLARRSYSLGDLRNKLAPFVPAEELERALERLQTLNLLNDADYAYNFALRQMKENGKGSEKVRDELFQHRVPEYLAAQALDRIEREFGEIGLLRAFVGKQTRKTGLPRDVKSLKKLYLLLRRRGFPEASIRRALQDEIQGVLWQSLDLGE